MEHDSTGPEPSGVNRAGDGENSESDVEMASRLRELEEEAERLAESHARKMVGMDQRRVIQGIKERLARERNFAL